MSAVVLGALVVLWAIVLLPMWLKRHERGNEVASADRFAGAMSVLSRRSGSHQRRSESVSSGRYVMMPARSPDSRVPHVSTPNLGPPRRRRDAKDEDFSLAPASVYAGLTGASRRRTANTRLLTERMAGGPPTIPAGTTSGGPAAGRSSGGLTPREAGERTRRLARRRQLVGAMGAAFVLTLILALAVGGLFIALQAFVDVLVLAGIAHIRAEVVADRARVTRRRPSRTPVAYASAEDRGREDSADDEVCSDGEVSEAGLAYERPSDVPRKQVWTLPDRPSWVAASAAVALPGESREDSASAAEDLPAAVGQDSVLAPRMRNAEYVPPAPRVVRTTAPAVRPRRAIPRTVDLTQPGKWTEQQTKVALRGPNAEPYEGFGPLVTGELVLEQRAEAGRLDEFDDHTLEVILDRAVGE